MLLHCLVLIVTLAQAQPQRPPEAPQQPPDVPVPAPADAVATKLAVGWKTLADGGLDAAVKAADAVLRERPWDRVALQLKFTALSRAQPIRALDEYDRWIATGHADEAPLLEPIAIGVLREIAATKPDLKAAALATLAAGHVPGAADALKAAGGTPQEAAAVTALLERTKSDNPQIRAGAVEALGMRRSDGARAAVARLRNDTDPTVRTNATLALAKMGDAEALGAVEQMLNSGVPDVQIMAARVYEGQPGPWVSVIRPLLDNPDGLTRLEAARLLVPIDPDAARRVLTAALADDNPVVRYESAQAIGESRTLPLSSLDIEALRRHLRDPDAAVRLAVAAVLLRLAQQ